MTSSNLRFCKKVVILPFERFGHLAGQKNLQTDTSNQYGQDVRAENKTTPAPDPDKGNSHTSSSRKNKELVDGLSSDFDDITHFSNAMAITYMLQLSPLQKAEDRQFLIYTQNIDAPAPADLVTVFHKLDICDCPLALIGNQKLRKTLQHFRSLKESDTDTDTEEENEDIGQILGKAWHNYGDASGDSPASQRAQDRPGRSHDSRKLGNSKAKAELHARSPKISRPLKRQGASIASKKPTVKRNKNNLKNGDKTDWIHFF